MSSGIVIGIMAVGGKPKLTSTQFSEALARLDRVMAEAVRLRREITEQMAAQRARDPQTIAAGKSRANLRTSRARRA